MLCEVRDVRDWPDPSLVVGETAVDIALKYGGEIPSEQQRGHQSDLKQIIRKEFSRQLRVLWHRESTLKHKLLAGLPLADYERNKPCVSTNDACAFFRVAICGFSVIPLVSWHNRLRCELDITFMGWDTRVLKSGGDLDNRLKTLFDALRMPQGDNEVPNLMFGNGEDLFCLLEDDSLIRKFSVEARESLSSPTESEVSIKAKIVTVSDVHPDLYNFR